MKSIRYLIFCCVFGVIGVPSIFSQLVVAGNGDPVDSYKVIRTEVKIGDTLDFSQYASLKLHIRKTGYSMNEIILLDVGLLVQSDRLVFVPVDLDIDFVAKDADGKRLIVRGLYTVDSTSPAFRRSRDLIIFKTFKLVVGCAEAEDNIPASILGTSDNKVFLENNLFKSPLEGCVDTNKDVDISIVAEISNRFKAISSRPHETIKTLAGKIRSNTLKINVRQ